VDVNKSDYRRGIVLDSAEEFGQALMVYGGESVLGSGETQRMDLNAIGEDICGAAVGMAIHAKICLPTSESFARKLAQEAESALKSRGQFRESFDYTFNAFQHTSIDGKKVGDKYILELSAAYVGSRPEAGLAKQMNKPMALVSANANGVLSVVDDWWFNLDLKDALKRLPISKKEMGKVEKWAKYISSGGYDGTAPQFEIKHGGEKFGLEVSLTADKYLRPEGGDITQGYMQARDNAVVGGAWTTWAENGNDKIHPKVVQPSLVLSVSMPGKRYSAPPAVTPEEVEAVVRARNYISTLI
jgi:hypothetical protein